MINEKIIEAIKKLKAKQDDVDKKLDTLERLLEKLDEPKDEVDYSETIEELKKEIKEVKDMDLQKTMIRLADDFGRYNIIDDYWYYNGKNTGVKAAASDGKDGAPGKDGVPGKPGKDGKDGKPGKDGKDGKDGKPGKDGKVGKDGETPVIKIGKVETSDEYGGAKASFRKGKKENEYLLDLTLPRGPQGFMGFDATINGKSSIELLAGNNISVVQEGKKVFINSLVNPFELKVLKELPTENISSSAIYFTPSPDPKEKDIFIESIYVNKGTEEEPNWDWEELGSTKVDLEGYVQKSSFKLVENADGEVGLSITWED